MSSASQLIFNKRYDSDAFAYIQSVQQSGGTLQGFEIYAINQLYINLKALGLYNLIYRLWLRMGRTDGSARIDIRSNLGVFYGGWTHTTGVSVSNGINGYFDTQARNIDIGFNAGVALFDKTTVVSGGGIKVKFGLQQSPLQFLLTNQPAIAYRSFLYSDGANIFDLVPTGLYGALRNGNNIYSINFNLVTQTKLAAPVGVLNNITFYVSAFNAGGAPSSFDTVEDCGYLLTKDATIEQYIQIVKCIKFFNRQIGRQ